MDDVERPIEFPHVRNLTFGASTYKSVSLQDVPICGCVRRRAQIAWLPESYPESHIFNKFLEDRLIQGNDLDHVFSPSAVNVPKLIQGAWNGFGYMFATELLPELVSTTFKNTSWGLSGSNNIFFVLLRFLDKNSETVHSEGKALQVLEGLVAGFNVEISHKRITGE